ncbi:DUF4153 domain-containing protein [Paenibacillus illinoisensis]|uniref:DUF4153 domain-containing protein n=1 Tax=Paenibacillus illinoisensis TaxID=59845 RepID=UPI003D995130
MIEKILASPNRALITLLSALMLAVVHQYLFYGREPGVSYLLFVLLFYAFMYVFAKDRFRTLTLIDAWMAAVVLMLALTFLLFDNELLRVLNLLFVPGLIILHMTYLAGRKRKQWWDLRIIGTSLDHLLPQSIRHWGTIGGIVVKAGGRGMEKSQRAVLVKVLIGLAASFPILIVVIALLTSADGVFNQYLSGFPEWLNHLTLTPGFPRILWIIIGGILLFSYVWGFVQPMEYEAEKRENAHWKNEALLSPAAVKDSDHGHAGQLNIETESSKTGEAKTHVQAIRTGRETVKLDPIIVGTMLFVINCVYVLFVFVQFSYLFGAGSGHLPSDLSYAEYARSGFAELVLVTSINFLILIVALQCTRPSGRRASIIHQLLLLILVGCTAIMLYSAFMRLHLYEQAYGYTYIRFLVHAFMIFLALLLLIAGLRIRYTSIPLLRWYIVLSITAYTAVNYVGMDNRIAELNVERYHKTGSIDTAYLANLSADAIPQLRKFAQEEFPALKDHLLEREAYMNERENSSSWPSYNVARHRAAKELSKLRTE